jgi:hypothetical protein
MLREETVRMLEAGPGINIDVNDVNSVPNEIVRMMQLLPAKSAGQLRNGDRVGRKHKAVASDVKRAEKNSSTAMDDIFAN